jgi:hypothetical protein
MPLDVSTVAYDPRNVWPHVLPAIIMRAVGLAGVEKTLELHIDPFGGYCPPHPDYILYHSSVGGAALIGY